MACNENIDISIFIVYKIHHLIDLATAVHVSLPTNMHAHFAIKLKQSV